MNSNFSVLGFALAMTLAAHADVVSFPGCPWSETKVKADAQRVTVTDAKGRTLLSFMGEPRGTSLARLVVSQAVDRLVIDARGAFADGMSKLVFVTPDFASAPFAGRDAALVGEMGGARGSKGLLYFEGHTKSGQHYYKSRPFATKGHRKAYPMVQSIPDDIGPLHLRWDLSEARGPIELFGAIYALSSEMPATSGKKKFVEPELLFYAPFDGTPDAEFAKGSPKPILAWGLGYDEGKRGKAVRLTKAARSSLEYVSAGNLVQERGTVSLWFRREWRDGGRTKDGKEIWRTLFANPDPKTRPRVGSGQLMFWWWADRLRADQADDDDEHAIWGGAAPEDDWNHLAVTWDETGVRIYLNGKSGHGTSDGVSPMSSALKSHDLLSFDRELFATFCVGHCGTGRQFDGLIDELRIYSAPLSADQVRELWKKESVVELTARGCYSLADTPGELTVKATSPAGCDISKLTYCLCDESGKVVCRYREKLSGKQVTLAVNLPAGRYTLRVTDGVWFYGSVPILVMQRDNPYELTGEAAEKATRAPGRLEGLELVQSLKLDKTPPPDRFRAVGPTQVKHLGGVPYLEAGPDEGNRFALRFNLDTNAPLYCFEIDYPDDAVRTADLIVQRAKKQGGDYTMQVGYVTGDEYPNTGRMLTHRCLYWTSEPEVALVAMTARANAPAAIAAVRIYRVRGGALPAAAIREPKPADGPSDWARLWHDIKTKGEDRLPAHPAANGWKRSFGLYFEDPAIGYDFATGGHDASSLEDLIDRTAALMKFTGQNIFAYPGAWYHGLIGEQYNPRSHAPDFLSAWYAKFDQEGLFLMPTVNPNTMPVPDGLVTRSSMGDGSLHGTPIAIHSTGKPNWGGWHDTPPNFNFHHPKVRKYISRMIDDLVAQGKGHPSFKGVCLHMTRHCMLWFGDEESGYNDYTVAAFAKAKGLKIPVKKGDPMRGKAYAEWLRANAWNDWIQWRCDEVTAFYASVARKLAAARPDLKLWMNSFVPANVRHPDFMRPDFMERANRACGLDRDALTAAIPNLILCQTLVPADYRFRHANYFPSPEARAHQRVLDTLPGFYSLLRGAKYPWVNQHDRYWESPIGRASVKGGATTLSCDWLNECTWRVSTLNPSGVHALRHFVLPLRYGDVLGMSKGGFLIGTYGMENVLVPFVQAFRALPAVVFDDVGGTETVKLRHKDFDGRSWFYIVNTDMKPARVKLSVPKRTHDLVTDERVGGVFSEETLTLQLKPYEMRSFSAPEGRPQLLPEGK